MTLRFRRSIKLAPGIRMNFSGSGASWTLGPRGASIGIGKRGTYLNSGIPGTGLYSRTRVGGTDTAVGGRSKSTNIPVSVAVTDDGTVHFRDPDGNPLSERLVSVVKKQQGDAIRDLIQKKCDEINSEIEALGEIHLYTQNPDVKPRYRSQEYEVQLPTKPTPKKPGLMGFLFNSRRERVRQENAASDCRYEESLTKWHEEKSRFDEAQRQRKEMIERRIYSEVEAMAIFLEENLQSIVWPRETTVSTEILDSGACVFVDVDLPEIEDMPQKTASAPQRAYRLSVKDMAITHIQRLYMRHVHGIGFRIIGETFAALPNTQNVVLSGFSQRPNAATGRVSDEYLYSVRVARDAWSRINFKNLQSLDVVEALGQFELRRTMTKTGTFKAIEPFAPNS